MTRAARQRRVFYVEEPMFDAVQASLELRRDPSGVHVAVPHLPDTLDEQEGHSELRRLIDDLIADQRIDPFVLWCYTPMALAYASHLAPAVTVYDCMDELSAFAGAPPEMVAREADLLARADLVFTGGQSLFEAKERRHPRVHLFPSSVDVPHFARARRHQGEPPDQAALPRPRLGYFGVIDERMDLDLLAGIADRRPAWQIVLLGPFAKIAPDAAPRRDNLHYLGMKSYDELPAYLSGWDVALIPFARNEATRFISPTKTPEYLAAGRPVVSTSLRDVVRPYGDMGLVRIADTPDAFVEAADAAMAEDASTRTARADAFLAGRSWDRTWADMDRLIADALEHAARARRAPGRAEPPPGTGADAGRPSPARTRREGDVPLKAGQP